MKMKNELTLARELYDIHSIREACEAFASLADICVEQNERYVTLAFGSCRYSVEETIAEFENYLIGLSFGRSAR